MHPDWLIPDWPAPAHVRAVCTTRAGGVSAAPYDSLNLGDHVGDAPAAVAANRRTLAQALGVRPVFLSQVHGSEVVPLDAGTPDATRADGCVTSERGVACAIMVADCLPVLFTDAQGLAVAAAHAGWRGLAGEGGRGVLEATCAALRGRLAAQGHGGSPLLAWLGPCIGPDAFEVGGEVRAAFLTHDAEAAALFRAHTPGKWLADLAGLARRRLAAQGIPQIHGNDGTPPWCTVTNASRFFSHRRDSLSRGGSGRLAACIWRG